MNSVGVLTAHDLACKVAALPWRRIAVGGNLTFGSSPNNTVRLADSQDSRIPNLSSHAGVIHHSARHVVLQNRSYSHELVVRAWGASLSGDHILPCRVSRNERPFKILDPGLWWVRNGNTWRDGRRSRDLRPHEVAWVLVEIAPDPPMQVQAQAQASGPGGDQARAGVGTNTVPSGSIAPLFDGFRLTPGQHEAFVLCFREHLAIPPVLAPVPLDGAATLRAHGKDFSQRRSEILSAARKAGYSGYLDGELLSWVIRNGHLTLKDLFDLPPAVARHLGFRLWDVDLTDYSRR